MCVQSCVCVCVCVLPSLGTDPWLLCCPVQSGSGRAMSVLREVAPAHQLRMQIAELEEANSELSARLQVRRRARMGGSSSTSVVVLTASWWWWWW